MGVLVVRGIFRKSNKRGSVCVCVRGGKLGDLYVEINYKIMLFIPNT